MLPSNSFRTLLLKTGSKFTVGFALAVVTLCLYSTAAKAAGTITVNTPNDEFNTGVTCSLREAIESANTDSDFGGCLRNIGGTPPYTVNFLAPATYTLSLAGANSDDNATGDLDIRASMTIDGGVGTVIVEAGPTFGSGIDRVFHVVADDLDVTFNALSVRHGRVLDDGGDSGGGIANSSASTVTVQSSVVISNSALGDEANEGGGGLFNDLGGTLIITDTTISNNDAAVGSGSGGGILNRAGSTLIVTNSTINNNMAARAGGGIESNASPVTLSIVNLLENATGPTPGNGGGLHLTGAGTVTVTGGMIVSNTADAEGGGLWNSAAGTMTVDSVEIVGNRASGAAPNQGGGGIFNIGGDLTVVNTDIRGNIADGASGSGGGILNRDGGTLNVSDSTLEGNRSMRAGGGVEDNASTTTLTDVDLFENTTGGAPGNGGGLHSTGASNVTILTVMVMSNTAAAEGGGLWNSGTGTMMVDKAVIVNNHANGAGVTRGGGGIFNIGGPVNVSNSTIGENSAVNNGGGVKVTGGGITLTNVTLFENSVDGVGSAVVAMTGTVTIRNSIVAATNADDSPLCVGTIVVPAFVPNLASDDSCGASIVDNPMLGTLMNNGGSTLTYMLNPTSRAIDAGDDVLCNAAPINNVDQRSFTRMQGLHCDLGAFESDAVSQYFRLWLFWIMKN